MGVTIYKNINEYYKKKMGRNLCTAQIPWDNSMKGGAVHPDAKEVGEQEDGFPGGDIVKYKCPNCGITFKSELSQ